MTLKAVNDTAGPNGLLSHELVPPSTSFPRAFLSGLRRINSLSDSGSLVGLTSMKALRRVQAERQINDAINTRNGPSIHEIPSLPLQSEVCVWREKNGWQGPFKVMATDGHIVTVDMLNVPATFRSTVLKPYYRDINTMIESPSSKNDEDD
ncbi:hypothetical protein EV44_g3458 [Erysiphe necator]|uniref:Uncharacterized protein n=1 Tax=Uncinula necator TaxID=52586 RepID=A0A0B1NZM6_UNCNE|nr:hypothetical protein EV44_g3458 [Erysiphe necator]